MPGGNRRDAGGRRVGARGKPEKEEGDLHLIVFTPKKMNVPFSRIMVGQYSIRASARPRP